MTSSWCSHGTYQHKAITSRSRQLLMMGTRLPRNMLSNYQKRNKEYKKWHPVGFSYPHRRCRLQHKPVLRLSQVEQNPPCCRQAKETFWTYLIFVRRRCGNEVTCCRYRGAGCPAGGLTMGSPAGLHQLPCDFQIFFPSIVSFFCIWWAVLELN